jgi:hypothetical protein
LTHHFVCLSVRPLLFRVYDAKIDQQQTTKKGATQKLEKKNSEIDSSSDGSNTATSTNYLSTPKRMGKSTKLHGNWRTTPDTPKTVICCDEESINSSTGLELWTKQKSKRRFFNFKKKSKAKGTSDAQDTSISANVAQKELSPLSGGEQPTGEVKPSLLTTTDPADQLLLLDSMVENALQPILNMCNTSACVQPT